MGSHTAEYFSNYEDDLFSHMIGVNIYTPLCFFFALQDASIKTKIVDRLIMGIEKLSHSFPWLTGQVVRTPQDKDQPSAYSIAPFERMCRLIVKDYTKGSLVPSLDEFRKAKFPCRMIDGELLTSLTGIPNSRPGDAVPVFFVQANFVDGGLVLSFAGEHSVMDGHGTGQVVRLLSKACKMEDYTKEELLEGNRIRRGMIPLLDQNTYKPGSELDFLIERPSSSIVNSSANQPPSCSWTFVRFSSSDIATLKELSTASDPVADTPSVTYITSNDAISAFIWQCVTRARNSRLPADAVTTIGRAVDARSALSISSSYLGNLSNHAYTTLSQDKVLSASLSALASNLRSALQPNDIAYAMRSLATHVASSTDRSKIHYGANMDFSRDIFLSSWAKLPSYHHDFGLELGFPEAVRRPGFLQIEGLLYLLPMDKQGAVDAMICLRDDDLKQLQNDQHFSAHSEWIG